MAHGGQKFPSATIHLDSLKSPIFLNKINHQLNIPLQSLQLKSIIFMLPCLLSFFLDGDVIFSFMYCNSIYYYYYFFIIIIFPLCSIILQTHPIILSPLVPYFCHPQNQSPIKHSISISTI